MQISKLQYITNYQSDISHLKQVKEVIKAGVKWIQYRPKESDTKTILEEGRAIAKICKQHNVIFIINDNVNLAIELNADGVHLGKNDMALAEARKILGNNKIIGGTSNTAEDIIGLINQGVNYVGLGPYAYTRTKKNLSPTLGTKGCKEIIYKLNKEGYSIPIVAIGGIREKDVPSLLNIGLYGLAISSLISEARSISLKAEEMLDAIKQTT